MVNAPSLYTFVSQNFNLPCKSHTSSFPPNLLNVQWAKANAFSLKLSWPSPISNPSLFINFCQVPSISGSMVAHEGNCPPIFANTDGNTLIRKENFTQYIMDNRVGAWCCWVLQLYVSDISWKKWNTETSSERMANYFIHSQSAYEAGKAVVEKMTFILAN